MLQKVLEMRPSAYLRADPAILERTGASVPSDGSMGEVSRAVDILRREKVELVEELTSVNSILSREKEVQMELRELNRVETEDMQRQIKELREDKQRVQRTLQTND